MELMTALNRLHGGKNIKLPGLKFHNLDNSLAPSQVSTLVVEWIEICAVFQCGVSGKSPPSWWSGLKCYYLFYLTFADFVSTLVVEWIEILPGRPALPCLPAVSTLVVEWIEISCRS